jgi:anti-sigma regulatory factor (Ser/Thr protein kinase)
MTCDPRADGLEVCLHDQGQCLDFDVLPELDPLETRKGGRGILLIRRLLDRVTCEHPPEGGNVLRMFKSAQPA